MNPNFKIYSYTKSIRFRLEHKCGVLPKIPYSKDTDFSFLISQGENISRLFKQLIYQDYESKKFRKTILIKKQFLKNFFKNDFYANKLKNYSIDNINFLNKPLNEWLIEWENNLNKIRVLIKQENYNKTRRSEIAELLAIINSKTQFQFVKAFGEYVNSKNSDYDKTLRNAVELFEKELVNAINNYLPSKTSGLIICKGSMNYYTVNKKPKDYKKILVELREEFKKKEEVYIKLKLFKAKQKSLLYELINKGFNVENIKKEVKKNADEFLNSIKEKEEFKKIINLKNYSDLFNNDKYLKRIIELMRGIKELNKKMLLITNSFDKKKIKEEINKLKKIKGFYFIKKARGKERYREFFGRMKFPNKYGVMKETKGYTLCFRNWVVFNDIYKKIAMDKGRIYSRIKGIERELIESQSILYWVFILEDGRDKYLWLVPKDKMGDFKKELKNKSKSNDVHLFISHSLTMRALHKLCFAEQSSFVKEMPEYLRKEQEKVKKASNDKNKNDYLKRKGLKVRTKDELKLFFLKKLMNSDYAHKILDLKYFNLKNLQNTKTLNDFEEKLESACYYLEKIGLSRLELNELQNKYNILNFKITSYDLENRNKNTYQTKGSDYKRHTKEIWNKFWSNDKSIRLNPEIQISFREKNEGLISYLKNKGFNLNKIKNRFIKDQYTLRLTFTLNAGRIYSEIAFAKTNEIEKKINEFNKKFNEQNWYNLYKYGIDRGTIEFVTLCIAKFNKNEVYEYRGKNFLIPKFPNGEEDLKVYELRKKWFDKKEISTLETKPIDKRKPRKVIANISYFIDRINDSEWFNKKTCTCIDLTIAKVINDKLILNGDILTYLKYKKEAAKKVLFELVSNGIITSDDKNLEWENNSDKLIKLDKNNKSIEIYHFDGINNRRLNGLFIKEGQKNYYYTKESVKQNLQDFIDRLLNEKFKDSAELNKHVPSALKLNHLRKAIVANMIGVISYLQKIYPGIIILESLSQKTIKKQFSALNLNVHNIFEKSLIQRFQTMGLVPPHINNFIEIRDKAFENNTNKIFQFGAIIYVDESGTSANCPYCEKKWDYPKKERDNLKFIQHRFVCGPNNPCGFDTKSDDTMRFKESGVDLTEINDPDKIAAYNVSKKVKFEDLEKESY